MYKYFSKIQPLFLISLIAFASCTSENSPSSISNEIENTFVQLNDNIEFEQQKLLDSMERHYAEFEKALEGLQASKGTNEQMNKLKKLKKFNKQL